MLTTIIIGKRIEEMRKKNGLSQTQLAGKLSVSSQAVGKWERGESMPDIIMFNRIAEVLSVDLNYFSENFQATDTAGNNSQETSVLGTQAQKPGWNMSGGVWADADFSGLKNLGEKFSGANITNCLFVGSEMLDLKLRGNNMIKNNFSNTDFSKSQIKGSQIANNIFSGCRFNEALLSSSNIKDCDFSDADFTGATFKFNNMQKNKASGANWNHTVFSGSQLTDMVFEGAVADCSFVNCDFTRVTFQNAILTNTFFKCKTKKIRFIDCKADNLTYAFLKNGKSEMSGITLI